MLMVAFEVMLPKTIKLTRKIRLLMFYIFFSESFTTLKTNFRLASLTAVVILSKVREVLAAIYFLTSSMIPANLSR